MHDRCLAMYVCAGFLQQCACEKSGVNRHRLDRRKVKPHVFCVGLYLVTCCENIFAFSGFRVISARCMHSCLKLPTACAGGAFGNEARVQVTLKLTMSLRPTARGEGLGSAAPRRQTLLSREIDQCSYCRFGAFYLTSGRECLVSSVLVFVKYTF
jgi:hypothetical protein